MSFSLVSADWVDTLTWDFVEPGGDNIVVSLHQAKSAVLFFPTKWLCWELLTRVFSFLELLTEFGDSDKFNLVFFFFYYFFL